MKNAVLARLVSCSVDYLATEEPEHCRVIFRFDITNTDNGCFEVRIEVLKI